MLNIELLKAVVLDTHAWVWLSAGDARAAKMEQFCGRAVVSAISVWEVAMLVEKRRLVLSPTLDEWVGANLQSPVELEPVHPSISIASARLANFHGDPADRIIVATAALLGLPLVTADTKIIEWSLKNHTLQVITL